MTVENGQQRIQGYCALCWSSCGCTSVVEDGRLVAVEPDPTHPTGKALCAKGRAAPDLVHHADRLLYPMKRTRPKGDADPGWQRISWDEALETTAAALRKTIGEAGSEAVAFSITTVAGTSMQDGYPWVERLRQVLHAPNAVASIEICNFGKDFVYPHTFGASMPMPDLAHTGCIVLWGHNPSATWLAHGTRVADARARGAKLVVVDPLRVGFAAKADEWLRVRPGSDGALALSIAGVMIDEGWFDSDFVRTWTNGPFLVRDDTGQMLTGADLAKGGDAAQRVAWDGAPVIYDPATGEYGRASGELALSGEMTVQGVAGDIACRPAFALYADLCGAYTPERAEKITWVPATQIRETARLMGSSGPVSCYAWSGLEQSTNAGQTNRALATLYALTGSFDAKGGNVLFETVPVNDVSGGGTMPEKQRDMALGLKEFPLGPQAANGWITTDALYDAVLEKKPYAVNALVSFGVNALVSHADPTRGARALDALDFMMHVDMFMTPTASHADIVLPVNTAWEREGLRTDFLVDQAAVGHVQLRPQVIESRGESRSDAWIAFALAERMGYGNSFWNGDIDAGYREMLAPSGIELETLRAAPGGVPVPLETRYRKYAEDAQGFNTPSKKVEIYSETFQGHGYAALPEYVEPAMGPVSRPDLAEEFPLVLTSAKSPHFLHSQGRGQASLRRLESDPRVELHPTTASARQIKDGEWVSLVTPHGALRAKTRFSETIDPRVVRATHGWWQACTPLSSPAYDAESDDGANLNRAIGNDDVDPIGGSVPHRSYLCQIQRLDEQASPNLA